MSFESMAEPLDDAGAGARVPSTDVSRAHTGELADVSRRRKLPRNTLGRQPLNGLPDLSGARSEKGAAQRGEILADLTERRSADLAEAWGLDVLVEAAHDMRSPLTSIMFLVDVLRQGRSGPLTEIQERQLSIIYGAAISLSTLVDDAMGLGRDSDRLYDWKPEAFSLAEVMSSVCDLVRPMAEERGVELRVSTIEPDRRLGHHVALYRVLVNLATNALKFTSEGFVEISCRALSRTRVEWSVSDSGRGMDRETLASIDQFLRRRQLPRQRGLVSAGLGMAICRRLLDKMGSELTIDTQYGQGTRFYFKVDLPAVHV
jgi:two-component system sensor histidine kinase EvgS